MVNILKYLSPSNTAVHSLTMQTFFKLCAKEYFFQRRYWGKGLCMSLYPRLVTHPHAACLFRKIVNFFHCLSVFSTILTAFSKVFSCFCKRPKICLLFNFYGTRQSSAQVPVLQDFNGNSSFDISKAAWALKNLAVENPFCVAKYLYCYAAHIWRFYSLAITQWLKCLKFCGILCKFLLAFCRESTEGSKKRKYSARLLQ